MEEKRKNKRMELDSQIVLNRLDIADGGETTASISVKDVSKSGIGFTCDYPLQIGAVYECLLTIWTKETIKAFVEIVRIEKQDESYMYGGIFIGMPEIDMQRIEIYSTFQDAAGEE